MHCPEEYGLCAKTPYGGDIDCLAEFEQTELCLARLSAERGADYEHSSALAECLPQDADPGYTVSWRRDELGLCIDGSFDDTTGIACLRACYYEF